VTNRLHSEHVIYIIIYIDHIFFLILGHFLVTYFFNER